MPRVGGLPVEAYLVPLVRSVAIQRLPALSYSNSIGRKFADDSVTTVIVGEAPPLAFE